MENPVFVVGRVVLRDDKKWYWKLRGVYLSGPAAEKGCETKNDFVRPIAANAPMPEVPDKPTKLYFPLREKK